MLYKQNYNNILITGTVARKVNAAIVILLYFFASVFRI